MKRTVALVAVVQLALVAVGVAPQLSARVAGEEYQLLVAAGRPDRPLPRGLRDPRLPRPAGAGGLATGQHGRRRERRPLRHARPRGRGLGVRGVHPHPPEDGPYLACDDRDWAIRCGIESWFVPQDEAAALEQALADDGAIATIKVDSRGNAAIVALEPR